MEPVTATAGASALVEVYRVGGIVLVLLVLFALAIVFVWRSMVAREVRMASRLDTLQDTFTATLLKQVQESTLVMREVADSCKSVAGSNERIERALAGRPCLVVTETHHRTPHTGLGGR